MNGANYKDTKITLTEAVLVSLTFAVDLEHVLVWKDMSRNNKLEEF